MEMYLEQKHGLFDAKLLLINFSLSSGNDNINERFSHYYSRSPSDEMGKQRKE